MSELTTIVQAHAVVLGVTIDWPKDPSAQYREYSCPTCQAEFRHRFNIENWNQALKRAGLKPADHPKPVAVS